MRIAQMGRETSRDTLADDRTTPANDPRARQPVGQQHLQQALAAKDGDGRLAEMSEIGKRGGNSKLTFMQLQHVQTLNFNPMRDYQICMHPWRGKWPKKKGEDKWCQD